MNVEFRLPGRDHLGRVFLTWTPVEARVRVANPTGTAAVPVTLGNGGAAGWRSRHLFGQTHGYSVVEPGARPAGQRSVG